MNNKVKLITSIITLALVALFLSFGIAVSLLKYKYPWNSAIDLIYVPNDVSLQFQAKINNDTFIANAEDGEFDRTRWEIPENETTFTKRNKDIKLNFTFVNKSSNRLSISIAGIIKDKKERFTTTALNESDATIPLTDQPDGTMSLSNLILEAGVGKTINFSLNYKLIKSNMNIGGPEDKQTLAIKVELE